MNCDLRSGIYRNCAAKVRQVLHIISFILINIRFVGSPVTQYRQGFKTDIPGLSESDTAVLNYLAKKLLAVIFAVR